MQYTSKCKISLIIIKCIIYKDGIKSNGPVAESSNRSKAEAGIRSKLTRENGNLSSLAYRIFLPSSSTFPRAHAQSRKISLVHETSG